MELSYLDGGSSLDSASLIASICLCNLIRSELFALIILCHTADASAHPSDVKGRSTPYSADLLETDMKSPTIHPKRFMSLVYSFLWSVRMVRIDTLMPILWLSTRVQKPTDLKHYVRERPSKRTVYDIIKNNFFGELILSGDIILKHSLELKLLLIC